MSFSFSFTARSDYSARQQLHAVHAPAAVKAVVEHALNTIKWPAPKPVAGHAEHAGTGQAVAGRSTPAGRETEVFGVIVEAWGHLADAGGGTSEIQRFIVRPLTDAAS